MRRVGFGGSLAIGMGFALLVGAGVIVAVTALFGSG
jgi:hypothetical protein